MEIGSKTLIHDRSAGSHQISRRACLPLIATAILSPAAVGSAQAQDDGWQLYRREDVGFEIELPGKPVIGETPGGPDTDWIRVIEYWADPAYFDRMKVGFSVFCWEYRTTPAFKRKGAREYEEQGRGQVTRVTWLTMYGVPAVEIESEAGMSRNIDRRVIVKNWIIAAGASEPKDGSRSPLVQRFFDSLKLLPRGEDLHPLDRRKHVPEL